MLNFNGRNLDQKRKLSIFSYKNLLLSNEINYSILTFVGPESEYYLDRQGLLSETVYVYRVKAYNSITHSEYSNTATVEIESP